MTHQILMLRSLIVSLQIYLRMARSFCLRRGKTAAFGGTGGTPFWLYLEGHSIHQMEARFGDKTDQFLHGLRITLTDGTQKTFGTFRSKGQLSSQCTLELIESIESIIIFCHKQRIGGISIVTTSKTHHFGHLIGKSMPEMVFHNSKLLGVHGSAGADIDRLGFIYGQQDLDFYEPLPLPEQRISWKSNVGSPIYSQTLFRPLQIIERIDLTVKENEIVGICTHFSNKSNRQFGDCADDPSQTLILGKNRIVNRVTFWVSSSGFLSGISFRMSDGSIVGNEKQNESNPICFDEINAQITSIQLSATDDGKIDALAILFSSRCERHTLGQYLNLESTDEPFEDVSMNRRLDSIFAYSKKSIVGIGFAFNDKKDIIRGRKTIDCYTSARLPLGANELQVKTKSEPSTGTYETSAIQFDVKNTAEEIPWSSILGRRSADDNFDEEKTICGQLIGAWGAPEHDVFKYGIVSTQSHHFTPLAGLANNGSFFETGCVYSLNRSDRFGSVVRIRSWWDEETKSLNGLQIQTASTQSDAYFVTDVGTLMGDFKLTKIPYDFCVIKFEVAIAPVRNGRLSGIRIDGRTIEGENKTFAIGDLIGTTYVHEFQDPVRFVGFFGFCARNYPVALGFVFDHSF